MSGLNKHRQLTLFVCDRRNEQILVDLNFHWTKQSRDFCAQSFSINDVPTFDRHDFVFGNISGGKQTASMDLTLAHFGLRRAIGKRKHRAK